MFTGLIEEIGKVSFFEKGSKFLNIGIKVEKILPLKIGESIAVNGVCLTVVKIADNIFFADVMHETVARTNLKFLNSGSFVNIEKSLTLQSFLGGHIVLGDVEDVGKILSIENDGIAKIYKISLDKKFLKYVVAKGRICVDGASLTVVDVDQESFTVSLIPHSLENLTIKYKRVGDFVNIESDIIAKHIEKLVGKENKSDLSYQKLMDNGFI